MFSVLGFRYWVLAIRYEGTEMRVEGQDLGFRVWGSGLKV